MPHHRLVTVAAASTAASLLLVGFGLSRPEAEARPPARPGVLTKSEARIPPARPSESPRPTDAAAAPSARDAEAVAAVAAAVDREIDAKLAEAKVPASGECSDAEFLRRASLDIIGRIPSADRVRAFLTDRSPDKRAKLVDELLASPEYGRFFGAMWYDLLVKQVNHRVGPEVFENWLADGFNAGRGWDAMVRDILTAEGRLDAAPAGVFWFSHTDDTGKGEVRIKPNDVLGVVAQRFLGMRLQCAECHNHPFTGYKQDDFWSAAATVAKVEFDDSSKKDLRKERLIPLLKGLRGSGVGAPVIDIPEKRKAVTAKMPDGTPYPAGAKDPRAALAGWLATDRNPAFARSMANRMWGHFAGRGFVNPVDDFRPDNAPSHPDALKALADSFAGSGFDLRHLIRCITATKAYRRSSDPVAGNAKDDDLFSHAAVRPMPPNLLFHSVRMATAKGGERRREAVERSNNSRSPEAMFVRRFKGDDDEEPELAEYAHGVPQVLWLMNGGVFDGGPALAEAMKRPSPEAVIEQLFLSSLSRPPSAAETAKFRAFAARDKDPAKGYAAAYWALLNSAEFLCNH